jgi:DNA-directed RNA polymerase subunit RPC12/RpoP
MAIPCFLLLLEVISSFRGEKNRTTSFTDYVEDYFEGLSWGWSYRGKEIINLHCLCPKCQYQIIPKIEHNFPKGGFCYNYFCEECGYKIPRITIERHEFEQKIQLKIQKKLRTGEWTEKINA